MYIVFILIEWSDDWNIHTESSGFQSYSGSYGGHRVILTICSISYIAWQLNTIMRTCYSLYAVYLFSWYQVNYNLAEDLEWGKNLGCDFVNKSCMEWMDLHPPP